MINEEFLRGKDIINVEDFTTEQLEVIIDKAHRFDSEYSKGNFDEINKLHKNKRLGLLFWENSTRTHESFQIAMESLGGITNGFKSTAGTSIKKNESIKDTCLMYAGYKTDAIVIRHPNDGAAQWAADLLEIPVLNGGDGKNQHPTQAFLDLATIAKLKREEFSMAVKRTSDYFTNLKIGFGGDLAKGRTVKSLMKVLSNFENISFHWAANESFALPNHLIKAVKDKGHNIERHNSIKEVMRNVEILYMTRNQKERGNLSDHEVNRITREYRVTMKMIMENNPDIFIMHPLPIDSKAQEIDDLVDYYKNAYYYVQAAMGERTREGLLDLILPKKRLIYSGRLNTCIKDEVNSKIMLPINKVAYTNGDNVVKRINRGVVLDHIPLGGAEKIIKEMEFSSKGYDLSVMYNAVSNKKDRKDLIKVNERYLSNRYIKQITMMYPNVTFNIIDKGKVIEKFKYKMCDNDNCITRVINEDVPVKFDGDNCHYCGREKIK